MSRETAELMRRRVRDLKDQLANGTEALKELDARRKTLQDTLCRIEGAIEVLEEEAARLENQPE